MRSAHWRKRKVGKSAVWRLPLAQLWAGGVFFCCPGSGAPLPGGDAPLLSSCWGQWCALSDRCVDVLFEPPDFHSHAAMFISDAQCPGTGPGTQWHEWMASQPCHSPAAKVRARKPMDCTSPPACPMVPGPQWLSLQLPQPGLRAPHLPHFCPPGGPGLGKAPEAGGGRGAFQAFLPRGRSAPHSKGGTRDRPCQGEG